MKTSTPYTFEEIEAAVRANGNKVINDNPTAAEKLITLSGLMVYKYKEKRIPVGVFGFITFTLNEVYLDAEGVPHISRHCTCGIFNREEPDTLEESISKFNNSRPSHQSAAGNVVISYVLF